MKIRRVVTGHSADGKAIIASDTEVEATHTELLGGGFHKLWESSTAPTYPDDGSPPGCPSWFPPVGGFRVCYGIMPPDSNGPPDIADQNAAEAEMEEKFPGLLGVMEADDPGMHRSDTMDFIYMLSGQVVLELDDGVEFQLKAGDTFVQSGTRHRWHNRGDEPAHFIGFLVGAHRREE